MMRRMLAPPTAWPTALLPALRLLWQRTLFPGRVAIDRRCRATSLAVLIFLPAVLLYPCLQFHLLDPDEGRYAEIPREMLARGEWVVPQLLGEPYLDKPPLLYWLIMIGYSVFGVHDWSARIVPALAVHGTILTTYLIGRNRLGERAAFRGALLLALTPGLMGMGRLLILDGLLAFWVTLGLLAGWSSLRAESATGRAIWWKVCALACGFGVLTKGPVALVLVLPPLFIDQWLNGKRLIPHGRRGWLIFAAIAMTINLPWYVAIWIARPDFGPYFFVQHNLQRFLDPFDHIEPVWYYIPVALGGLLPGSFYLWRLLRGLFAGDASASAERSPDLGFAVLAGCWCFAFFSLSGSKLPTYILPAFPMLCLALGATSWRGNTRCFHAGVVVWTVGLVFVNFVALPWYAAQRSPMGAPAAELRATCSDPESVIRCYPRECNSAAFYLGRDDLQSTRSKFVHLLIADLLTRERTVVLFTHRHSYKLLKESLPPELSVARAVSFRRKLPGPEWVTQLIGNTPWGLCDLAVIKNSRPKGGH
jgi:4-amino-4-deoxy-L-arabinose transferase-like glycosyltransferase